MMEWAIHVKGAQEVRKIGRAYGDLCPSSPASFDHAQVESGKVIGELFGRIAFSRIYFGNEFCEHLIPPSSLLARIYSAAQVKGLAFTLLTPYVTDEGIEQLKPLFEFLAGREEKSEVVVNDWGVLRLLRREFPRLIPVLGRLMNKMLRDPLATTYYALHAPTPKPALFALRRSNLSVPIYQAFLKRSGIRTVEVDNVVQGIDMDFNTSGFTAALYVPYGFIATGRICLFASLNQPKEKKFTVSTICSKECQRHYAECSYNEAPFKGNPFALLHRGNTVFYPQGKNLLHSALLHAEAKGIKRIIYQPRIPM